MATYRAIPCSAFRGKIRSLDKECQEKSWDCKRILAEALFKYNDIRTNKEWTMDLKEADPPPNPLALPAFQRDKKPPSGSKGKPKDTSFKKNADAKVKSWKYMAPKGDEPDTQTVTNKSGQKENRFWCGNKACNRWTLSHTTAGHGKPADSSNPPKAESMKIQGSLKTFLAKAKGGSEKSQLSKRERKQLQALLTTMNHDDDSDAAGLVDLD